MVEEVEIQEPQLQQEPDPPKKKLWKSLSDKHLYTKSYEDFGKQFSTPESIDKLHKVLTEKELYTKNTDDFKSQFFSDLTPQVKKKGWKGGLGRFFNGGWQFPITAKWRGWRRNTTD